MAKASSPYPTTRVTLIDRLIHGDNRDWQQFFAIYAPILLRIGGFARLTPTESDDLVANVMRAMLRAVRGGFRVDHKRGRFRSFLRKIANYEIQELYAVRNRHRGNGVAIETIADPNLELPEDSWETIERQELLRISLERVRVSNRVSQKNWDAFDRYVFRHEPAKKIAESLNVEVNRFYGIIFEIKQRIKAECSGLCAELGDSK